MRNVALLTVALGLALAGCSGRDTVAEGTPVYDGNKIVRWTGPGESFSANVRPGQPYVVAGRVELNR